MMKTHRVTLLLLGAWLAACTATSLPAPAPTATQHPSPTLAPAATPLPAAPAQSSKRVLALVNGTLIDGAGAAPLPDAVVVIADGRIVAVGPASQVKPPATAQLLDVAGATILPGFTNAHVHAGYNAANLKAWAQAGVTTVRDLGTGAYSDACIRRAALRDPANARLVAVAPPVTAPGKVADVLVVNGDPLAELAALIQVRLVVHDGVVVRGPDHP